jgi:hypothetical protein
MTDTIKPPHAEGQPSMSPEEARAVLESAGLKPGEIPFGPILREGLRDLPPEDNKDLADAYTRGIVGLADLRRAERLFRDIAIKNGIQGFDEAADIIHWLGFVLRTGNTDRLQALARAVRDFSGKALGWRRHERLRALADALDERLADGIARPEVYGLALSWLPIYAPSLCPLRSRKRVALIIGLLNYRPEEDQPRTLAEALLSPKTKPKQSYRWLEGKDGAGYVRLAAHAYGLPRAKARHLFDAEEARFARRAGKRK